MNTQESIKILDQLMRSEELHYDTEATDALHHAIEHLSQTLPAVEQEARFAQRGAPEGWQLVPKKPTVEMKIVGRTTHWKAVEIYKEMLSAAPEPPQERKD